MTWVATTLGHLCRIEHGFAFLGEHFSDQGKLVVLTPGNFHERGGFRARPGKDRFYSAAFPNRYLLRQGDLIVAMTEQGEGLLGSAALVPHDDSYLHNQRIGLVKESAIADRRFLYYLFNSTQVREQIRNSSSGAKVRHTSPDRMYRVQVFAPGKVEQTKIAGVLSAYDDLIANTQRRIALLESMAEEIYREWFVRKPSRNGRNVLDAKRLPEGWALRVLPELAQITYGFPFDGSRFNTDGVGTPIIRIRNVLEGRTRDFTDQVADEKYIVRSGDLLIGMDGEFHLEYWHGDDAYLVQRVCRIKAKKDAHRAYLSHALRSPIAHLQQMIVGATVGHLGAKHLNVVPIAVPGAESAHVLSVLNELLDQQLLLEKQVNRLAATRDSLLPRLISGKLRVDHLDTRLPPSMQDAA